MYEPKVDICNSLKTIEGVEVYQKKPKKFLTDKLPAVTFFVLRNETNLNLDNEIATQDLAIQIDVWADRSTEATNTLKQIEAVMRENFYTLRFSQDFDDPSGLNRITTRFEKIR